MDLLRKFTSRKFLLALTAVVLSVYLAATGVITWDQAMGTIKIAVAFYLATEGGVDIMAVFKDLLGELWQKKLQATIEERVKKLLTDFFTDQPAPSSPPASPSPATPTAPAG